MIAAGVRVGYIACGPVPQETDTAAVSALTRKRQRQGSTVASRRHPPHPPHPPHPSLYTEVRTEECVAAPLDTEVPLDEVPLGEVRPKPTKGQAAWRVARCFDDGSVCFEEGSVSVSSEEEGLRVEVDAVAHRQLGAELGDRRDRAHLDKKGDVPESNDGGRGAPRTRHHRHEHATDAPTNIIGLRRRHEGVAAKESRGCDR